MAETRNSSKGRGRAGNASASARGGYVSVFRKPGGRQPTTSSRTTPAVAGTSIVTVPSLRLEPGWNNLRVVDIAPKTLLDSRLVAAADRAFSSNTFDVLRTTVLQAAKDHGWRRVLLTAPTRRCGTTFVAANLALSLSRGGAARTLLVDLELRNPSLAATLGIADCGPLLPVLQGLGAWDAHLRCYRGNLALALNDTAVPEAAETLLAPETRATLARIVTALDPDVVLYDMPAALSCDDVQAFLPAVDAVIVVVDGTKTLADDISRCEALLADRAPVLGFVLNRAEDHGASRRRYGKGR
ncbi:MAG: hypothetical protein R3D84_00155 [Paracoccaceae bacterium]